MLFDGVYHVKVLDYASNHGLGGMGMTMSSVMMCSGGWGHRRDKGEQ